MESFIKYWDNYTKEYWFPSIFGMYVTIEITQQISINVTRIQFKQGKQKDYMPSWKISRNCETTLTGWTTKHTKLHSPVLLVEK